MEAGRLVTCVAARLIGSGRHLLIYLKAPAWPASSRRFEMAADDAWQRAARFGGKHSQTARLPRLLLT